MLITLIAITPYNGRTEGFEVCNYNSKRIMCKREFADGRMTVRWADGASDTFRLIKTSTTTTAKWEDTRKGKWNSLSYGDSLILKNESNGNTMILRGTVDQCLNQWRLGSVCLKK